LGAEVVGIGIAKNLVDAGNRRAADASSSDLARLECPWRKISMVKDTFYGGRPTRARQI
jgi:hypothetical protein